MVLITKPRVRELGEEFPQLRIRCDWCLRCADWRLAAQGCAAREIRGRQKSDAVAAAPGCPGEALRVKAVAGSVRSSTLLPFFGLRSYRRSLLKCPVSNVN